MLARFDQAGAELTNASTRSTAIARRLVAEERADHDRGRAAFDQTEAQVDQCPGAALETEVRPCAIRVVGAQP